MNQQNKYWTSEFHRYYLASQKFASKKWWQFWIVKPKEFVGEKFQKRRELTPDENLLKKMFH